MRLTVPLFALLIAACGGQQQSSAPPQPVTPKPPAEPERASAPEPAPEPHPTPEPERASAPEPVREALPALLRRLDKTGQAKLKYVTSVCRAALAEREGRLQVGCRTCPPFDSATGPDGKIAVVAVGPPTSEAEFYELERILPGAFTKAGAEEAALVFAGCEPHSGNWGGTLLIERRGERWVSTSYRSGFHPEQCKTFRRPDGRDLLVCRWQTDHQSYSHDLLDSYDFSAGDDQDPTAGFTRILSLDDNTVTECFGGDPETKLVKNTIENFSLTAAAAASPARLLVDVRLFSAPKNPRHRRFCDELQSETPGPRPRLATTGGAHRLEYTWNGAAFAASAKTRQLLARAGLGELGELP